MIITTIAARLENNKVIYVRSLSRREDGKYLAETTFEPAGAKDFNDMATAHSNVRRIHNPLHREYAPIVIEVERQKNTTAGELI